MAAGPQTIGGVVNVLNEVNKKGVFKLFSEGTFTLDITERGDQGAPRAVQMSAEVEGRYVKVQLHTDGNPNVAVAVRERRQYPRPGSQTWKVLKYKTERMVASLSMTTEVMEKSQTSVQAVFRVHAREMAALMQNIRKQENLYCLQDGSALMASAAGSTSWNDSTKVLTVDSTQYLKIGMEVVPRHKTNGSTKGGGATLAGWTVDINGHPYPAIITAKTATTITLTYFNGSAISLTGGSSVSTAGFGVYLGDGQGSAPYGLDSFCTTTNPQAHGFNPASLPTDPDGEILLGFGGVDRAVLTQFQSRAALDFKGAPISVKDHLEPEEIAIVTNEPGLRNEDAIIVILPGRQWNQIIHNLQQGQVIYERTKITTNKWNVVRSGIFTFGWDPDCPPNTAFVFAPQFLFRMELLGWGFEDLGGSMYNQLLGGIGRPTGEWQLNAHALKQLICTNCRANSKWINIGPL